MDFQQRAQAAFAGMMANQDNDQHHLSPAEAYAKSLTDNDKPTIESAIKSYMSLCAARSWASSSTSDSVVNVHANDGDKCHFIKSTCDSRKASLLCARAMLKILNEFVLPEDFTIQQDENNDEQHKGSTKASAEAEAKSEKNENDELELELERKVVRIVWNGMIQQAKQKPCKVLGRLSLHHVYPYILSKILQCNNSHHNGKNDDTTNEEDKNDRSQCITTILSQLSGEVDPEEVNNFFTEFGCLLQRRRNLQQENNKNDNNDGDNNNIDDDDGCLLWDLDGGEAELKRRRERRETKASTLRNLKNQTTTETTSDDNDTNGAQSSLTIEEIHDEEE